MNSITAPPPLPKKKEEEKFRVVLQITLLWHWSEENIEV